MKAICQLPFALSKGTDLFPSNLRLLLLLITTLSVHLIHSQTATAWVNDSDCDFWVRYSYQADDTTSPIDYCECNSPTTPSAAFVAANTTVTGSIPAGTHMCNTSLYADSGGTPVTPAICIATCFQTPLLPPHSGHALTCYKEDVCGSCDADNSGYTIKICP